MKDSCILVDKATKKSPAIVPSWWYRGPGGMVEEWETRVSEEEIIRRQKRWQSIPEKAQKTRMLKPSDQN